MPAEASAHDTAIIVAGRAFAVRRSARSVLLRVLVRKGALLLAGAMLVGAGAFLLCRPIGQTPLDGIVSEMLGGGKLHQVLAYIGSAAAGIMCAAAGLFIALDALVDLLGSADRYDPAVNRVRARTRGIIAEISLEGIDDFDRTLRDRMREDLRRR
ncbi:hypothetical protein Bequi_13450 [Brachybacterium sp. JHP9]|uniref:MotA/TolQ/ExbB proton channel domain-containing protein n=1 Tax=Brachybacterium equifaecis TaxID=2910770 RepID=A0ABT0R3M2_9MICO|nr:hypothetical protein [Brachybacterium equifaecis]MCL6424370.1 hypothetical protein [Brachybacterium equifaecis]